MFHGAVTTTLDWYGCATFRLRTAGSQTGLSIGSPVTSSAATSTGALSTVPAVRNDRLPIDGSHRLAAICPAAS